MKSQSILFIHNHSTYIFSWIINNFLKYCYMICFNDFFDHKKKLPYQNYFQWRGNCYCGSTMSRHWVSPSPFLSSSSHTTLLHYTNSYTYSHSNLNFLQYTIQKLVPHVIWSAPVVRDLKIDHTQRHVSALRGTQSA